MKLTKKQKVVIAMFPQKSLRDFTGQAGGCREKTKVIVAMSGGVDSAVAAALLKKAGHLSAGSQVDVIGVFMKFWKEPGVQKWNRCCSPDAERRAKKIAMILGIPFFVLNLEKEFKKNVVEYFIREYKRGLTPNPCVVCNKEIKFGLFLGKALKLKADYVATGHYARIQNTKYKIQNIRYKLLKAKDKDKDQSYFLWQLNQEQLKKILFPLGNLTKKEVKKLAKRFKLPVSEIPESQEICFIQTAVSDFLRHHLRQKSGNIIDVKGKALGRHQGLAPYTIGQRKGIGLPGGPYFVLEKDLKKNTIIVTKNEKDLFKKELIAGKVNWIFDKVPQLPLKIRAKIRYRQKATSATIYKIQDTPKRNQRFLTGQVKYRMLFNRPQRAITPGQSVVFYRGKELLGGGIIR